MCLTAIPRVGLSLAEAKPFLARLPQRVEAAFACLGVAIRAVLIRHEL